MNNLKKYSEYIKENQPFDAYPGPPVVTRPGEWLKFLYPDHKTEPHSAQGYGFSFPYKDQGHPITRWSGDGRGQIGIKGGPQSGKIGGEFDNDFRPGGEVERELDTEEEMISYNDNEKRNRKLDLLKTINEI